MIELHTSMRCAPLRCVDWPDSQARFRNHRGNHVPGVEYLSVRGENGSECDKMRAERVTLLTRDAALLKLGLDGLVKA